MIDITTYLCAGAAQLVTLTPMTSLYTNPEDS